ncbi:MAG: ABC transporter permease [Desulfuromonas sp.]|nr:ABC transporter permease [Desulfuromonas sp.]
MFERIWHMLKKEFIQTFCDPRMKAVIFAMPVVQTLVFGYAVTTDIRNVPTAIYDQDRTPQSRELVARFSGSGYFNLVFNLEDAAQISPLLDRGEVKAVVRIDQGFGADLETGRMAPVQILVDGSDSNTAGKILNYASQITSDYGEQVLLHRAMLLSGAPPRASPVELETRSWFNPNLESRNYYVPGVIALIVMLITLMLSSMAVVREKEIGTIEQIMVTPITQAEFILGKTVPFALIGFVDVLLITAVAVFWFEIPLYGNILLLLGGTALYLMSTLGIGLLISTVSRTQQQAMMSTFFFYFPAVLLSGFMFPIANMPSVIQWVTYLNPLRYFLVIVRGIFLKGVGSAVLWPEMVALAVLGTVMLLLAMQRFRKTQA